MAASSTDTTALDVALGDADERLIEASAGTGKTYALTTLVARLLVEQDTEIGKLLVVTFTVAATGELRDRIRATLRAVLRQARGEDSKCDTQAAQLLARWQALGIDQNAVDQRLDLALVDLDRANVMTIHGFCQRLLADFAFDGGLPFAFSVAGDGFDTLVAAVHDAWRRHLYSASECWAQYATANGFTPAKLVEWASGYVAKPSLKIRGAKRYSERSVRKVDALEQAWCAAQKDVEEALRDARERITPTLQRKISNALAPDALTLEVVTERQRESLPGKDAVLAAKVDALERARSELLDALAELLRSARRDVIERARATINQRVREDRRLGYDDLLTGVHEALRGSTGERLARRIRERYPWALIDEYQDTDRVQADIFRRIYRDVRHEDDTGALFIVGDPKQSIYRFRSADIFSYLNTSASVPDEAKLHLTRNYRSAPALTTAVNAVFDHECPFALNEIRYDKVESAVPGAGLRIEGDTFDGAGDAPFQLRYFPPEKGKDHWTKTTSPITDLAARLAADEIAQLLALAGAGRAMLGDKPVSGSDIAVLVRTTKQGRQVGQVLRERGIGSIEIGIENVFASREAEYLERLLWAIARPQSPNKTRGALASDLFGLSAGALAALQDDDSAWSEWTERLGTWLEEWQRAGVATFLRRILESEDALGAHRLLRYPDGARRLTNVMHLAELLQTVETQERYSPPSLAAWFTRQRANARDRDEVALLRLDTDEQLVKIVTAHAAKGLEFPIVFCPFVWDSRAPGKKHWAEYHGEEDDHPEFLDLKPSQAALDADWLEQFSDEARLLYVMLTRAKERCVVTWAKVTQAEYAPLSWLLYARDVKAGEVDAKLVLGAAKRTKALNSRDWRSGLDGLVNRTPESFGIVDVDPGFESPTSVRATPLPLELEVRERRRDTDRIRQMTSYSALAHSTGAAESPDDHETVEQPDRDEVTEAVEDGETVAPEDGEPARDAFSFPGGTRSGNCLHRIFERLDRREEGTLEAICRDGLERYRIGTEWLDVVQSLVENTRGTVLVPAAGPGRDKGFRLDGLARPLPEMEFHLPLEGLDRRRLGNALAAHRYDNPFGGSNPSSIDGFLRGFIDLVAGHDGVWYVLDYKSNWLGRRPEDYRRDRLKRAMAEHRYPLQYLLYLTALHRYLSVRLPDYDYDEHVGGAFYLFLRGIDPAAGMDRGIYFDRPDRACIEALDACFQGSSPG